MATAHKDAVRFLKVAIAIGELSKADGKKVLAVVKTEGGTAAQVAEDMGVLSHLSRQRVERKLLAALEKKRRKQAGQQASESSEEAARLLDSGSGASKLESGSDVAKTEINQPAAQPEPSDTTSEPEPAKGGSSSNESVVDSRTPRNRLALVYGLAAVSGLLVGIASVTLGGGSSAPASKGTDTEVATASQEQAAPRRDDDLIDLEDETYIPPDEIPSGPAGPMSLTRPGSANSAKTASLPKSAAPTTKKASSKKQSSPALPKKKAAKAQPAVSAAKKAVAKKKTKKTAPTRVKKKAVVEQLAPARMLLWTLFVAYDADKTAEVGSISQKIDALGAEAPEAFAGRGFHEFLEGDYPKAVASLSKAGDIAGPRGRIALARAKMFLGQHDEALAHLGDAEKKSPLGKRIVQLVEGPFRKKYPHAADALQMITPDGHYRVMTDLGLARADISALEAKLRVAQPKSRAKLVERFQKKHQGLREVADTMDKAFKAYDKLFNIERKADIVPTVYVFSQRSMFDDYSKELQVGSTEHTLGYYLPYYRVLVFYDLSKPRTKKQRGKQMLSQATLEVLLHETFHQWIHLYTRAPHWFNEGLAEYFGISEMGKKELRFGLVPKRQPSRLSNIRDALRGPGVTPLELLLQADRATFMAPGKAATNYAQAWSFCHFLGSSKKGKKLLRNYFKALREGKNLPDAFEAVFGKIDMRALEKQWEAYVFGL